MSYSNTKPKIIIANWKMNPAGFAEAEKLLKTIKENVKKNDRVKIVICPPAIYLAKMKPGSFLDLGVQNVFWEDKGAYTGEISSKMAKSCGVNYAIIGHSERRIYLKETNEAVNLKIKSAFKNNLKPILCVGETLEEREKSKTGKVIADQLEAALKDISSSSVHYMLNIAYEPVWAIGTGKTPSLDEVMSAGLLIKKVISRLYDRGMVEKVYILYGGSVNSKNALDFVDKAGMDGLLVGGASLNASEFVRIVNLFG